MAKTSRKKTIRRQAVRAGVRVRMYRHGLGDCFLLTFPTGGARPFHVLIDCGVILGTRHAEETMTKVARDIGRETGKRLDLVVVTHEHWDHVSGFLQAREEFEEIAVDRLWLAWTENTVDRLARELRGRRAERLAGLRAAVPALRAADGELARRVEAVLGFAGPPGTRGAGAGGSTADALGWLVDHAEGRVDWREPGEPPLTLEGVDGVRVFVLGPPRDLNLLHRDQPRHAGNEVYHLLSAQPEFECAYLEAVRRGEGTAGPALAQPFDARHRIPPELARSHPFLQAYFAEGGAWRKIDTDWLGGVGELALQLDSDTNNTSLALAIELPGGKVLLFPGDAQVGNWLSWQALEWQPEERGRKAKVTGPDLLRRTVLYKVGHHGSHNATLNEKGLELMTSPELVALLPVDEAVAHDQKGWKRMPFLPMLEQLRKKTMGRLLQSDRGPEQLDKPDALSQDADRAWQAFTKRVHFDKDGLYVDYDVPL